MPFIFELVRMWSNYKIKRLCVVFAMLSPPMLSSVIPPTVEPSIVLLASDGVRIRLGTILGQFSIIYFRG